MSEHFPIAVLADAMHGRDAMAQRLESVAFETIARAIPELGTQNPNVDWNEILTLLRSANGIVAQEGMEGFQKRFRTPQGVPDAEKIAAFSRLQDVLLTVRSYAPVIVGRSFEADHGRATADLKSSIQTMKKAGYSLEDAVKFFKDVKISKSFTVHPTEHLNEAGIALCRKLVAAAELPADKREAGIADVIAQMIRNPIGATHKNSIMEEIDASDAWARIHNEGCSALERQIGDFIEEEYGQRPEIILDISPRSWDYDSDGKNNAEGWAMMAKMATTTMGAFDDTLAALATVPGEIKPKTTQELVRTVTAVKTRLQPIYERSRAITQELADTPPEQRRKFYMAHYDELKKLTEEFAHIYDDSDPKERGFKTYRHVLHKLDALRKGLERGSNVDTAFRNLRRTGFALEKGQTRQNDIVHTSIIDNFFNSAAFRDFKILSEKENAELDKAGKISALPIQHQYALYGKVIEFAAQSDNRKKLIHALFESNPLSFEEGGNGYPSQERTLLDRFALRALYPLKFDQGIISDAGEGALTHQKFIADLFGMDKMRHMPLFEDRSTLSNLSKLVEVFNTNGGSEGVKRRSRKKKTDKFFEWYYTQFGNRAIYDLPLMVPCSDSTRGAGSGALMEITHEIRKVVRKAFELSEQAVKDKNDSMTVAFEIMLGGGLSMGRFGADVGFMRRVIEQEMKQIAVERGQAFDRKNHIDLRLMRMAGAILYTEQGRAKRYYTATPGQVADDFARRITGMIEGRLDLEGLVPDYTYIQKPYKFSNSSMEKISVDAWKIAIEHYINQRFLKNDRGEYILDNLADIITCPNVVPYLNNGARPLSKKTGNSKMTGVRAIENDERNNLALIFTSGYGMGAVMQYLKDKVDQVVISENDVREMLEQPEWKYLMFTKEIANAKRADFSLARHKLTALGKSDGEAREYLETLADDHDLFMNALADFTDIDKQFPVSDNIAQEHKKALPGLCLMHMVEDYIAAQPENTRKDTIKILGGESFLRALGSSYRSGTMPHWPLWTGHENCYVHNRPEEKPGVLISKGRKRKKAAKAEQGDPAHNWD